MRKQDKPSRIELTEATRQAQSLTSAIFLMSERERIPPASDLHRRIERLVTRQQELLIEEEKNPVDAQEQLTREMMQAFFHSINIDITAHRNKRDATFNLLKALFDQFKKARQESSAIPQVENIIGLIDEKLIRHDFLKSLIYLLVEEYNDHYASGDQTLKIKESRPPVNKEVTEVSALRDSADKSVRFDNEDEMFDFGKQVLDIDINASISFLGEGLVKLNHSFLKDNRFSAIKNSFNLSSRFVEEKKSVLPTEYTPIDLENLSAAAEQRFVELIKLYP